MQRQLTALRLTLYPPEVYIRPELKGVGIEDFRRLEEIVAAGREATRAYLEGRWEGYEGVLGLPV
jgi:NTE family protein